MTDDWLSKKSALLSQAKTLVLKIGSAVITNAQGLETDRMAHLAEQIVWLLSQTPDRRIIVVTSGAVAAGRCLLRTMHLPQESHLSARQALAAIGQAQLMQAWDHVFRPHNKAIAQVLLTRDAIQARKHFLNIRNTFAELMTLGVIPIVNENDTVSVQELTFGDNDSLASLLANLVHADLFVNLTQAEGVLAENPQKNPHATVLSHIDAIEHLDIAGICGGKSTVGTGGMYSKLRAARRCAQLGVPTLIVPGTRHNVLKDAFAPQSTLGTFISAKPPTLSQRKYWLAYQSDPQGTLLVDDGCAKAILDEGGSLLPGGILEVTGVFPKGALVCVRSNNEEIAVGLTNYASSDIKTIKGLKRHEVAAILGDAHYPEVIHRDNMVLHAVL
ncbi:MAG: glutamate 5-kinase [Desulfovibrio sp.]|nr:glutamate 5-kinase [Desulfovibrio sp.]